MTEQMNTWLQFLAAQGAQMDAVDPSQINAFNGSQVHTELPRGYIAPLTDLGLISATGDDAANFLHNQLTNDVEHLGLQEARLAGYCSPKGRLLATFLIWKTGDTIMLQLSRQIQATVQKRLQMFVLRAKAKLADVTDNHATLGIGGQPAAGVLQKWFPELPATPFAKSDSPAGTLIRVADAFGEPRYQWIASIETAQQAWPELIKVLTPIGTPLWRLADIHAGMPRITQATQEQFVPQMINFELIGGVNFKKGCYPGQEIVARSQYLGKLKRRMFLAHVDAEAAPGDSLYSADLEGQVTGTVVNAAPAPAGGFDVLAVAQLESANTQTLHLKAADGAPLTLKPLPYALPE